jgi:hypothetical protein
MRIGISGARFLLNGSGAISLTLAGFSTAGFFILTFNDHAYALGLNGYALALENPDV